MLAVIAWGAETEASAQESSVGILSLPSKISGYSTPTGFWQVRPPLRTPHTTWPVYSPLPLSMYTRFSI